jgi:acyl-CoA synthetase (AMP-forming)/AMP-acid ligase II
MHLLDLLADGSSELESFVFHDDSRVTTNDLWRRSDSVIRWLTCATEDGEPIAAVFTASRACLVFILGALRSGVDLISLPHPSRGLSLSDYARQLRELMASVGATRLFAENEYVAWLQFDDIHTCSFEETLLGSSASGRTAHPATTFVQFSSGTTARAKGIRLDLEAIAANVTSILSVLRPRPGDSSLSWLPLSHDMGFVGMCLVPWAAGKHTEGGKAYLLRPESFLARPLEWIRQLATRRIAISAGPCFALDVVSARASMLKEPLDLSPLRALIVGAEPIRAAVLDGFEQAFRPHGLRDGVLCPAYGLAEATLAVTMVSPDRRWSTALLREPEMAGEELGNGRTPNSSKYVSCGPPIPGCEVRTDASGAVSIRGPGLMRSYVGEGAPRKPDAWFATSDLGQIRNQELFIFGRRDDILILGGRQYDAVAMADSLAHLAELKRGSIVALVDHGGDLTIVAESAVPESSDGPSVRSLLRTARAALVERFGVAPRRLVMVRRGNLPKTPSGKPKRFLVRQLLAAGELDITEEAS